MDKLRKILWVSSLLSFLLFPNIIQAQTGATIAIDHIDNSAFPTLDAYISVSDSQGSPIEGIQPEDFALFEDNNVITGFDFEEIYNTDQSLAFVIAIDTSGSMAGDPLYAAKLAAVDFIDNLAPQDLVSVVSFSAEVSIVSELSDNKDAVADALKEIVPADGTALYDAILQSVDILSDRPERKVLVLLTDGGVDFDSASDYKDAVAAANKAAVPIYTIGFGDVDIDELTQMAEDTGGTSYFELSYSTIADSFKAISEKLRRQYHVTFESAIHVDDLEHELRVVVDYEGSALEATNSFIAKSKEFDVVIAGYQPGDIVGGLLTFSPEFRSISPLAKLEVFLDETLLAEVSAPPFQFQWDFAETEPGEHNIRFYATDAAGNVGETSITLNFQPPAAIDIISPKDGSPLSKNILISVNVDTLYELRSVDILVNQNSIHKFEAPSADGQYQYEWAVPDLSIGEQNLLIVVTDENNNRIEKQITISPASNPISLGFGFILIVLILSLLIIVFSLRSKKGGSKAKGSIRLVELEGHTPGNVWKLDKPVTTLGRKGAENDIRLKGTTASRFHATIRVENGQATIAPLSQENPVAINSTPMSTPYQLKIGDIIQLGESSFRVEKD